MSWNNEPLMPLGASTGGGPMLQLPQYPPAAAASGYPTGASSPPGSVSSGYPSGYPTQPGHSHAASQPPQPQQPFNPMDQYVQAETAKRSQQQHMQQLQQQRRAAQQPQQQQQYPAAPSAQYAPPVVSSSLSAHQNVSAFTPQQQQAQQSSTTSKNQKSKTTQERLHFVNGERVKKDSYSSMEYMMKSLGLSEQEVMRARNEHVDMEPDMCMEDTELRDYAGTAILVYFRFLKFVMLIIGIHFVLGVINFAMYADQEQPKFSSSDQSSHRKWYSDFFITAYTSKQRAAWMGTTIAALIVVVIGLIWYRQVWIGWFKYDDRSYNLAEAEEGRTADDEQDTIIRFHSSGSLDVGAHYRSVAELSGRRVTSFLIFCGFIAVQVVSSIAITKSEQSSGSEESSVGGSFAIAFIAAGLNIAFTMISRKLTEFEKYERLAAADRSLVLKLVCFKIANIMAVYGAKQYGSTQCVYDVIGEQFMTMLLVEIFFTTPSTLVAAAVITKNKESLAALTGSINGDDRHRARFELPVEYLAALYKFLMAAMAMVVFPLSTLLAFLAFLVEFWGARYRLIKLCGKPVKSEANHRNVVVFIMFLIFVCVIVTPFAGAAFILSGESMRQTNTTDVCGNFPSSG